jgi:hypothetical protein
MDGVQDAAAPTDSTDRDSLLLLIPRGPSVSGRTAESNSCRLVVVSL